MGDIKEVLTYILQEISQLKGDLEIIKRELINTQKNVIILSQSTKNEMGCIVPPSRPTDKTPAGHLNIPTDSWGFKPLNAKIFGISIGNGGVPTDKQTDQPTDKNKENSILGLNVNPIEDAAEIIASLDSLRKEIGLRFKRLTKQEIVVFSTIYQIEEEAGTCDYRVVSQRLGLTESSIRDYVGKLIKKGIPVEKKKINNKTISLSVSEKLKRITSLSSILQLRDL